MGEGIKFVVNGDFGHLDLVGEEVRKRVAQLFVLSRCTRLIMVVRVQKFFDHRPSFPGVDALSKFIIEMLPA